MKISTYSLVVLFNSLFLLSACGGGGGNNEQASTGSGDSGETLLSELNFPTQATLSAKGAIRVTENGTIFNKEAVIPPQCYTKHDNQFNPCMTCHQTYPYKSKPNTMNDGSLQKEYAFSDIGLANHWHNLFEDRQSRITSISDQQVIDYIHTDNYATLIEQLKQTSDWQGPIPEITDYGLGAAAFDELGFAKDSSHWVAFNYKPLPSTFWPTNGSTDDVLIRLPEAFRNSSCNAQTGYSHDTYLANLSILEAAIKDLNQISVPTINEAAFCQDLNGDSVLGQINTIIRPDFFVGDAANIDVTRMLYPEGTQFLHSVRYVGIDKDGKIGVPPRMKELRYMRKYRFFNEAALDSKYINERQEKVDELIPQYIHRGDAGTDNSFGWMVMGFIEGEGGHLRRQTQEEHLFCMGCHTTIGTTVDQTFSFARKVTGADGWGYINLNGMKDAPTVDNTNEGEIERYLRVVGGGNEFRENDEIVKKFFDKDDQLKTEVVQAADVYELTTPSLRRALDLNKAYMTIVEDQDFIYGRDANIKAAKNVYQLINESSPVLPDDKVQTWDIRLDWD